MGALSFWGAVGGAGQGLAATGQSIVRDADLDQRQRERLDNQRQLTDVRTQAQRDIAEMRDGTRRDLAEFKAANGGGGKGGPSMPALDIAQDPEKLALLGGMDRTRANDYVAMQQGKPPTIAAGADDESGGHTQTLAKYGPTEGEALRAEATRALYQAVGLANPAQADDLSKARNQNQATDYAAEFKTTGSQQAARGALVTGGKDFMSNEGTDQVSGLPAKGSVAEARRTAEGALAGERTAHAGKFRADVDKIRAEIDGDIKGKTGEKLTTTLNAINGLIRTYDEKSTNDADLADRRELQAQAKTIAAELRRRGMPADPAAPVPAPAQPTIKALPPGAKQIGTSGGKPVYQTPDGRRFIQG